MRKVGPHANEEIRRDARVRHDNAGGTTFRDPNTWEEAHEVVVELEKLRRGTGAYSKLSGAMTSNTDHASGGGKGGKKGKGNGAEQRGVCYDMRDRGTCPRGAHRASALEAWRAPAGEEWMCAVCTLINAAASKVCGPRR